MLNFKLILVWGSNNLFVCFLLECSHIGNEQDNKIPESKQPRESLRTRSTLSQGSKTISRIEIQQNVYSGSSGSKISRTSLLCPKYASRLALNGPAMILCPSWFTLYNVPLVQAAQRMWSNGQQISHLISTLNAIHYITQRLTIGISYSGDWKFVGQAKVEHVMQ